MQRTTPLVAPLLAAIVLLAACTGEPTATGIAEPRAQMSVASRPSSHDEREDLETLRRATARFQNFAKAQAAGWSAQITACMVDATAGGMGFHYGNAALIDGAVRVDQPELLLYEPERHGGMRLVAVEYIIPYTAHARSAAPPVLFGQAFSQNDTFQLWGLHVWAWKHNPSGLYASWNPRVDCEHTIDVSTMAHH